MAPGWAKNLTTSMSKGRLSKVEAEPAASPEPAAGPSKRGSYSEDSKESSTKFKVLQFLEKGQEKSISNPVSEWEKVQKGEEEAQWDALCVEGLDEPVPRDKVKILVSHEDGCSFLVSLTITSRRHSVESILQATVKAGKAGRLSKIRRSIQAMTALRRGSQMSSLPKPGREKSDRPELQIPKPTLPGIGVGIGTRRRSKSITPVVWDPEGVPNPQCRLNFDRFRKAKTVQLSPDLRYATVRGQMFGGCVVAQQVLKKTWAGRFYEVIIEEVDDEEILFDGKLERRWANGMGIGFTTHPGDHTFPKLDHENYQTFAHESLPQSWLVGYDGKAVLQGKARFLKGNNLPKGVWKPCDLVVGDKVGILATEEGHILVFVNDEHRVVVPYAEVPWRPNLWPCIDLDGCTLTVSLCDRNAGSVPDYVTEVKSAVCRDLRLSNGEMQGQ